MGGKDNKYCEQPHTLIKDLFIRQRTHVNKWNKDLFAEDLKMSVKVSRLEQLPSSKMTSDLIAAAKVLNKHAYDMFVKSYMGMGLHLASRYGLPAAPYTKSSFTLVLNEGTGIEERRVHEKDVL